MNDSQLQAQLTFQTKLNQITKMIHSAQSVSDILVKATDDIASLLRVERLTIYAIDAKKNQLFSVKTNKDQEQVIRVPKNTNSIAGFCAVAKKILNIRDVYNTEELAKIHPKLRFDSRWDKLTGFRTRQVLVLPLIFEKYLVGVLQMINKTDGLPFSKPDLDAAKEIAQTVAIAFYNQNRAKRSAPGKKVKFGDLVDKGLIKADELEAAITHARVNNQNLATVLMLKFKIPKEELLASLEDFYNNKVFNYDGSQTMPPEIKERTRHDFWKKLTCAPLAREGHRLTVVTTDPYDLNKTDVVRSIGLAPVVEQIVGLETDIVAYLNDSYGIEEEIPSSSEDMSEILTDLVGEGGEVITESEDDDDETNPELQSAVVRLANKIIIDGFNQGVSDIHIEPNGNKQPTMIRFRRDGSCFKYLEVPASHRSALTSRLKIMSQLDISEKRKPQDGKIRFRMPNGRVIELRVAIVPTSGTGNEDIVMRILAASEPIPLPKLGMHPKNFDKFSVAVQEPYGLILCVGPTGSGKTTTLHSALGYINNESRKIWTAEDPVEITQKGLRQVQVQAKIGLTFAAAMRAFLRADPDVVMIGEMRDEETAAAGIEASLTGHLVFSTLHTNSAPETVTRLLDMGLDPFNFADALLAVLAQRLCKRICSSCKEEYHPEQEEYDNLRDLYGPKLFDERINKAYGKEFTMYRGKGCEKCNDNGVRGRMGLHELMMGTDGLKEQILERAPVERLRDIAIKEGMFTLLQDGIYKVLEGDTNFKEVRAVCMR